jgi:DNA-binding NarL/FixJ family response regulator
MGKPCSQADSFAQTPPPRSQQSCPPSQTTRRQHIATALIGPSSLLREGLTRILSASNFRIVASVPCVYELVLSSPQETQFILFIIDAADDPQAAIAEVRVLKEQYPAGRVAVLAGHRQLHDPAMLLRAGANVCVGDFATCDALLKSLELVVLDKAILPFTILPLVSDGEGTHEGEGIKRVLKHQAETSVDESSHAPRLSDREKSIVRCLAEGHSNKAIARKIAIAEATVKVHIKTILRKIRVQNRTQAAIWAMNHSSLLDLRE